MFYNLKIYLQSFYLNKTKNFRKPPNQSDIRLIAAKNEVRRRCSSIYFSKYGNEFDGFHSKNTLKFRKTADAIDLAKFSNQQPSNFLSSTDLSKSNENLNQNTRRHSF